MLKVTNRGLTSSELTETPIKSIESKEEGKKERESRISLCLPFGIVEPCQFDQSNKEKESSPFIPRSCMGKGAGINTSVIEGERKGKVHISRK